MGAADLNLALKLAPASSGTSMRLRSREEELFMHVMTREAPGRYRFRSVVCNCAAPSA